MASTTIEGLGGAATLPDGFTASINQWAGNEITGEADTTGFVDAGYHTVAPTSLAITGSCKGTGLVDTAPIPDALLGATPDLTAATGSMTLTAKSGCQYTFVATITNVSFNRQWNGKLDVDFDFKSSGPIQQVWVQS